MTYPLSRVDKYQTQPPKAQLLEPQLLEPQLLEPQLLEQRGAIMALAPIAIILILALGGLAVDAGRLYHSRLTLQKALDSAVLAGVGYTIQFTKQQRKKLYPARPEVDAGGNEIPANKEFNRQLDADLIVQRAQSILNANVGLSNTTLLPCTARKNTCFEYDSTVRQLSATATADINLLLLDLVPLSILGLTSVNPKALVPAAAAATRPPANLQLVLDISGSMGCPVNDPTCNCRYDVNGCEGTDLKVDHMVDAVIEFAQHFDIDDNLGVTLFSMRAWNIPAEQIKSILGAQEVDQKAVNCLLSGRDPLACALKAAETGSSTNACDALMSAHAQIQDIIRTKSPTSDEFSLVYMSDGPPTAGSFYFANPESLPTNNPQGMDPAVLGGNPYHYLHYTVEWAPPANTGARHYYGPSLLAEPQNFTIHWPSAYPPPNSVPTCHKYKTPYTVGPAETLHSPMARNEYTNVFDGCLRDFSFRTPDGQIYNPQVTLEQAGYGLQWPKLYYQCAIALSDMIRRQNGTIYSIGLGRAAALNNNDPFQNAFDPSRRKDQFLARLSADNRFMREVPQITLQPQHSDDQWQVEGIDNYDDWDSQTSPPRYGEYHPAPSIQELAQLFRRIAKRILLRLVA